MLPLPRVAVAACDEGPLAQSVRLTYAVRATRGPLGLDGESEIAFLRLPGRRYRMDAHTDSLLYRARQSSIGRIDSDGLVPERYTEQSGRRPVAVTTLDWQAGQLRFTQTQDVLRTEPGLQDRLSHVLHLAQLVQPGSRTVPVALRVAGVRGVATYGFEARGRVVVDVGLGRFDTWHFERPAADGHDRLDVWLAPALCGLPVKQRFADDRGLVVQSGLVSVLFGAEAEAPPVRAAR